MSTKIYAIRYGRSVRKRSESFIGGDPHDGPMPMAYYVWVIEQPNRLVVVDTGFDETVAKERSREFLICPGEAMNKLGLSPGRVDDVVLSHFHYDHAGNHHLFPNARFHIQTDEIAYVTGPWMTYPQLRIGYAAADLKALIDRLFADRLVYHEGDSVLCDGIRLYRLGGHTGGLMAVGVDTDRGPVLLASDTAVFYEGLEQGRAFPAAFHVGEELKGYRRLIDLAGDVEHIIPGHDIQVTRRYPEALPEIAWRVDLAPKS